MKTITFILTFFLIFNIYADVKKCEEVTKEVDFRNELPPIRDQDSIGWCYSFVAADIIGHHLFKNKDKLNELVNYPQDINPSTEAGAISATSLAINYNNEFKSKYNRNFSMWQSGDFNNHNEKVLQLKKLKSQGKLQPPVDDDEIYEVVAEGGEIEETIELSFDKGFCLEGEMPSSDFAYTDSFFKCEIMKESGSCGLKGVLQRIYDFEIDGVGGKSWCDAQTAIQTLFPQILTKSMIEIMGASSKENIIQNLEQVQCHINFKDKKPFKVKTLKLSHAWRCSFLQKKNGLCNFKGGNEKLFKEMDKQLERGKIIGIAYKSDFLKNTDYIHEDNSHASSIVGKRTNPETCEVEYLLRNSWGAGCEQYQNWNVGPEKIECLDKVGVTEEMKREFLEKIIPEYIIEQKEAGLSEEIINMGAKELEKIVYDRPLVSLEEYETKTQRCEEMYPKTYKNPKLKCEGEGYLIIPKSELKKNLYEITFIK